MKAITFLSPLAALMLCLSLGSGCGAKVTSPDSTITPQSLPKVLMTSTFSSPESGVWTIGATITVKTTVTVQILWDDPQGVIPAGKLPDFGWFETLSGNVVATRTLVEAPRPTFSPTVVARTPGTTGGTASFTVSNWAACGWGVQTVINPVPCYDTATIGLIVYNAQPDADNVFPILTVPGAAQVKLTYVR